MGRRVSAVPRRDECLLWLTNVDGSWKDIKKSKAHNMKLALQGSLVTFQGKISQGGADKNCDLKWWCVSLTLDSRPASLSRKDL